MYNMTYNIRFLRELQVKSSGAVRFFVCFDRFLIVAVLGNIRYSFSSFSQLRARI